jgi:crotonobetainyl-CoA:carnitine CoA-transferase CaiB-like acyl-CoA transferase
MRVVCLGESLACAQAALLLWRYGAEVAVLAETQAGQDDPVTALLRKCLTLGQVPLIGMALTTDMVALLLERADAILDDHPLAFWLERGINLQAQYVAGAKPRAHWCAITPYGLVGAGDRWRGCELTAQASGPFMIRVGEPGRPPLPVKGPQAEFSAGWHAALLLMATHLARPEGPGVLLDVSLQECQYMHAELGVSNWHFNGIELDRSRYAAGRDPSLFQTLDGPVHMLFHDREWPRVARMIGREDLAHDRRFMARYERQHHLAELDALLTPWFLERTRLQAVEAGQAAGMPIAFRQTPEEILADPQLRFRGAFEMLTLPELDHPIAFPIGVARLPETVLPRTRDGMSPARPVSLEMFLASPRQLRIHRLVSAPDPLRPLAGVRVLDLTNTWAGPRATTLLGDLGADVIKVEGVDWMDMLRGFTQPPSPNPSYPRFDPGDRPWDRYIMWLGLARNKRSVTIELTRPQGHRLLTALIAIADVVVTNMSRETRHRHQLDAEMLHAANPTAIVATLTAYGDEGPRSHWKLFGDGQAAIAGLFYGTGYERGDSLSFGAYGDPVNGTALAFQIVAALALRYQTGCGYRVDVSAVETCLAYNARAFVEAQTGADPLAPAGFDACGRWPHGVYRCLGEDRWLAISCGSTAERAVLAAALQQLMPRLSDASLAEWTPRDWDAALAALCATHEPETIEQVLRAQGIPCQHVVRGRDIDSDPVLASRRFLTWLWREDLGSYPVYAPCWLIDGARPPVVQAPPRLGEHNVEVLGDLLGLSPAQIAALRQQRVIAERPTPDAELGLRSVASDTVANNEEG